jgi:hypothetical protein
MKKNYIYIVLIAVLAALALWLILRNNAKSSFSKQEDNWNFAVKDTSAITRIEISDKIPSSVTLTKSESGVWMVNEKYAARQDAVQTLVETMHKMTMRNFVPGPMIKTVIKRLAVYGKEVKVYSGDQLIKHFYVGTETPDQLGTYMMIAGADAPYAVFIQGFNGYLNSRFFTEEELWRDRTLFGLEVPEIKEVKLVYTQDKSSSFIVQNNNGSFLLTDLEGKPVKEALNVNLNIFMGSFRTANFEGMIVPTDGIWQRRDSLLSFDPVFVLTVTDIKGNIHEMKAYRKGVDKDQVDEDGNPLLFDPNRLYAFMNDGRWVLIQYFGLRNIIVTKAFFGLELVTDN